MEAADSSAQVLIVGAGPVGQLAALLLSYHGIGSMLIDRRLTTLSAPKAHAINARTLEICDSIGVSAERLRELGANANEGGEVRFVGTLTGTEFGCLPYERQDEDWNSQQYGCRQPHQRFGVGSIQPHQYPR